MHLLEEQNCTDYLRSAGWIEADERIAVRLLTGGVSNVVFRVSREQGRGEDFVLKQARGQLRVEQPWFCSVERIGREVEVLRICGDVLRRTQLAFNTNRTQTHPTALVPEVLFEDRENYAFAMTAAPLRHTIWKQRLMDGVFDDAIAIACGELLGVLHADTWQDASVAKSLDERQFFIDLRVDPYYRQVATVHPDLTSEMDALIHSLDANRCCLVHGDFSPKNLLVWDEPSPQVMLIDCEVGHFGDPAFDLGFFLTHLVLKAVYHCRRQPVKNGQGSLRLVAAFWERYRDILTRQISPGEFDVLQQRAVRNLAGCLLARVDGKSPVEYLRDDADVSTVRRMGRALLQHSPCDFDTATNLLQAELSRHDVHN